MAYNIDSLAISKLTEIKDTLILVAQNTNPVTSLSEYQDRVDGSVAIAAMVIGLFAAFFSVLGWYEQKRSRTLLSQRNHRRPRLFPMIQKIYDDGIMLNILFEFDSDYQMSYTEESNLDEDQRPSQQKHLLTGLYPIHSEITRMYLPKDVIILDKYEIYKSEEIYNLAFSIREDILKYNRLLQQLANQVQAGAPDKEILINRDNLISLSRNMTKRLLALDEAVVYAEKRWFGRFFSCGSVSNLERELSLYIVSRFFNSVKFLTPEYILEDVYVNCPVCPVDFTKNVSIDDLYRRKKELLSLVKARTQQNPENARALAQITAGLNCIESIRNRKANAGKYKLDKWGCFKLRGPKYTYTFNDEPIKGIITKCLGNIYDDIRTQIDSGQFNMESIARYDTKMFFATNKHNLLMMGAKQDYDNERRRISKKALWNKGKLKSAKK